LFLSVDELRDLARRVDARWDYEVARETGSLIDDQGPPEVTLPRLDKGSTGVDRFPDGYYQRRNGTAAVVVARSPIAGGDLGRVGEAMARIRAVVRDVAAETPDRAQIRVSFAGDMPTGFAEYGVVRDDLLEVGISGIALVLLAVFLYF